MAERIDLETARTLARDANSPSSGSRGELAREVAADYLEKIDAGEFTATPETIRLLESIFPTDR